MQTSSEEIRRELDQKLKALDNLNPDLTTSEVARLLFLAGHVEKSYFTSAAEQTARLVVMYLQSEVKQIGKNIMAEYFAQLDNSARLLREAGEITLPSPSTAATFSTALVPTDLTEPLDFCKIINRAEIPKPLIKAADAFRRRNEVVDTVYQHALKVLWTIDSNAAAQWVINLFENHVGNLDPDIVRDSISVPLSFQSNLPWDFIKWIIKFAEDQNLLEYWPTVIRLADRLLCKVSLKAWFEVNKPRNVLLSQLRLYTRLNYLDDEHLLQWIKNSLNEIGNSVQRFMSFEKSQMDPKWKSVSLMREVIHIADLYIPTLLTADQILTLPDGTEQLAMAFMGLAGESRDKWENSVLSFSEKAVKKTFLLDMKLGRKPVDTIKLLTFGDQNAFNMAYAELDLASENFDSFAQRDKIARFLAVFYASFRRPQLLGIEIGKRYHNLMRIIHDDFLSQYLDNEQLNIIHNKNILPEIASIAAEARKFLAKRKAEDNTLEQMLAAKIAFERFVRQKRIEIIKKIQPKT